MRCPTCEITIHPNFQPLVEGAVCGTTLSRNMVWYIEAMSCPSCYRPIIRYMVYDEENIFIKNGQIPPNGLKEAISCPPEVPENIAKIYREAHAVLELSPNASGILSRKCLQSILKHEGAAKFKLEQQVKEYLNSQDDDHKERLKLYLNSIREFGNIGAHPGIDKTTGEEIELEIDEAEWMLDLLSHFMDHVFVQPAKNQVMLERLNRKLGKAPQN